MDARTLNLDCEQSITGWRVWCLNTGLELAKDEKTAEHAWAVAAAHLAHCLSDIRRSACNVILN